MIDYTETHNKKRIYIKIIAWVVLIVFSWQQVTYSWELPIKPQIAGSIAQTETQAIKDEIEVTNYDVWSYQKKQGKIAPFLPKSREQEQVGRSVADWAQLNKQKSERVLWDNYAEEMQGDLRLFNKRKPRDPVELEPKRKQVPSGSGGNFDYSLTDPDLQNEAHNLNEFVNPSDLSQINKYDVTLMNIDKWMAGTTKKEDDMGVSYWLGTGDGSAAEERLIMRVIYEDSLSLQHFQRYQFV